MNVEFIGKGIEWTDSMKAFVEGKLERFKRFLKEADEDQVEVVVTLSTSRAKQKDFAGDSRPTLYRVDMDIYLKTWGGGALHAWDEDTDPFSALDRVMDEIERQLIKLKQRRLELRRKGHKIKEEMIMEEILPHEEREKPLIIEEELVIEKPMSVEDAIFELQDSGVYFLPFVDISTGTLKIAYRKRGGNFGVINTKCKGM
ncbi:MAG: ribosome-associated translation inhibitor RaiA [Aquificota bacterium]|uniref:Ribosome hibernation promoting factor n=1 Tax=Hydrogenobacter sp. TaxID=2152829 RepID=A0A7C2V8C2_9AQUI|nr:ribosome-associated translation inhibitor RaiA [Aquificaceae bacterium]MDM7266275.1 ribosome-associated translation inhibitor RaiA [Aquificaceae bacterium]QWK13279.1 MAG: ribosome-associated translation inhibitor RaiA [Aquificota bacterium]HAV39576.1 ribosome-associated translation inhibitor RaiA [Aquificaceae bacterium]HCO39511.1 ribosome-associated translation inhibitor RaiA [Aquificaceae bacterium]